MISLEKQVEDVSVGVAELHCGDELIAVEDGVRFADKGYGVARGLGTDLNVDLLLEGWVEGLRAIVDGQNVEVFRGLDLESESHEFNIFVSGFGARDIDDVLDVLLLELYLVHLLEGVKDFVLR